MNAAKTAWSKKERTEYEHKAPRGVVDLLAAGIAKKGASARLFTVEDLLPLQYPQDGGEVPGYQVYVALAWLKSTGLVKMHGRRGYSARRGLPLADEATTLWRKVQELAAADASLGSGA